MGDDVGVSLEANFLYEDFLSHFFIMVVRELYAVYVWAKD